MNKRHFAKAIYLLALLILGSGKVFCGAIAHPEIGVYRFTCGDSGPNPIEDCGYAQGQPGTVEIPGVLDIVPGTPPWSNFISASQLSQPYTLLSVKLVKETPEQNIIAERFPKSRITQAGNNIRLHWPLMYDAPGTKFTLTIEYKTPAPIKLPGESAASMLHREIWIWRLAATLRHIQPAQSLFHSLPYGRSSVQLISDENLNSELTSKLAAVNDAYNIADFTRFGSLFTAYEDTISGAQIVSTPAYPNLSGGGTGITNTWENPAGSILLLDCAYIAPRTNGPIVTDTPDSAPVILTSPKVVTATGDGWFYVQDKDRISGLKVIGNKTGLSAGMGVLLQGTMSTQGPERVLLMTNCEIQSSPISDGYSSSAILPLGMMNRSVGGAGNGYLPGFSGTVELSNGSLLVRTWGKVTDTGNGFFYIDDGSGSRDGTQYKGIRIIALPGAGSIPEKNTWVSVTGISTWFDAQGYYFPAVLLRDSSDITVLKTSN